MPTSLSCGAIERRDVTRPSEQRASAANASGPNTHSASGMTMDPKQAIRSFLNYES